MATEQRYEHEARTTERRLDDPEQVKPRHGDINRQADIRNDPTLRQDSKPDDKRLPPTGSSILPPPIRERGDVGYAIKPADAPDLELTNGRMRLLDTLAGIAVLVIFLGPLLTAAFGPIN